MKIFLKQFYIGFILLFAFSCGESEHPEITSFKAQDSGMFSDFKDCPDVDTSKSSYKDFHKIIFESEPRYELYKIGEENDGLYMYVLGELKRLKDKTAKENEAFENVMLQNTYVYDDGVWEQEGKAKFFIKTVDKDGKIIEMEEDESMVIGAGFLLMGLIAQSDPEIGKCMKKRMDDFNVEDIFN